MHNNTLYYCQCAHACTQQKKTVTLTIMQKHAVQFLNKGIFHATLILCYSQCDLAHSEEEEVAEGEGESLAAQLQSPFVRTSAKHRINIDKCFKTILRLMREQKKQAREEESQQKGHNRCVLF